MPIEKAHIKDAFGNVLNSEETGLVRASQFSMAKAGAESDTHTVAAVKIEAGTEPTEPMDVASPMD